MIENRKSARHDVNIDCTVTIGGTTQQTSVLNLSVGGALFAYDDERLSGGTRVTLNFRIPTHDKPIEVGGTVRWCSGDSVGIQFDGLRAKEVWALNKFFESLP